MSFYVVLRKSAHSCQYRQFFKPHSLKQRVMVAATESQEFEESMDGIATLSTFLNQMSKDGCARLPLRRSFFGASAVEAYTSLFSHKHAGMEYEEIPLPTYMDPKGRLMEEVRRRSFCHTTDNAVHYSEIATVKDQRSVLNITR